MVTKICRWDGGVCSRHSCTVVLANGNVRLCCRHRNPKGRFELRKIFLICGY